MEYITEKIIETFKAYLINEEKSESTIQKYLRDIKKLADFAKQNKITMELLRKYKEYLKDKMHYKISSINTYLSAANSLFRCMGWALKAGTLRIQEKAFAPEERELTKEEYKNYK